MHMRSAHPVCAKKNGFSIVVVDDEPAFRTVLQEILDAFGYAVFSFSCVSEAMAHLNGCTPDLILSDLMMPETDGYQFINMLHDDPGLRAVPVVVISALARPEDIESSIAAGAAAHLTKPFTAKELRQMINEVLGT